MHFGDLGLPRALWPVNCVNSLFSRALVSKLVSFGVLGAPLGANFGILGPPRAIILNRSQLPSTSWLVVCKQPTSVEALLFDAFWGPGPPACAMAGQLCEVIFFHVF